MGNPAIPPQQITPPKREPTAHNGILSWVPAQIIAGGSKGLPVAAAGEQLEHQVQVSVPGIGPVRITYRLDFYKHRRSTFWPLEGGVGGGYLNAIQQATPSSASLTMKSMTCVLKRYSERRPGGHLFA